MNKTRYILTVAGEGSRWNNYLGVRKHFAPINGEPIILRTIRLIRQNDPDCEIYVGENPKYPVNIPDVKVYDGTTHLKGAESDRYFSSMLYWNKEGRTVLIWGDIFFTEDAIKKLCAPSYTWLRFARIGGYKYYYRKPWGEEFAISFNPEHHDLVRKSCELIENLSLTTGKQLFGAIYLAMLNVKPYDIINYSESGTKPDLGNMVIIDDMTDDFDFPREYDNLVGLLKRGDNISVLVAVPTAGYSRNDEFYDYYNMLDKPNNTICTFARGQSPARNRNLMIRQGLEHNVTHFLFLDDDIAFAPDLLEKLLVHADKDVVTALYLMRNYPHQPIIFDYADAEGSCLNHYPSNDENGLIEIVACGLGACLIRAEVFKKLNDPWIRLGELEADHWCDDIGFFRRVRDAGFKLYCDLSVVVGHMGKVKIWPAFRDGKWVVIYDTGGHGEVMFPAIVPANQEQMEAIGK